MNSFTTFSHTVVDGERSYCNKALMAPVFPQLKHGAINAAVLTLDHLALLMWS